MLGKLAAALAEVLLAVITATTVSFTRLVTVVASVADAAVPLVSCVAALPKDFVTPVSTTICPTTVASLPKAAAVCVRCPAGKIETAFSKYDSAAALIAVFPPYCTS